MTELIDSHCHLGFDGLYEEHAAVVRRANEAGVTQMINIESAPTLEDNQKTIDIARQYDCVFATIGIHPHDSVRVDEDMVQAIGVLAKDPKVVAIGEAGLDYHYDNSPRESQREAFARWIRLAREVDLPLVIHTRDAEADTLEILRDEPPGPAGAVIHCFTGSLEFAHRCVEMGLYISIPGVVTFKNPGDVPRVAAEVPLDRLLVETDSPFMSPAPLRGRRNEPSHVVWTARKVAELRGMSFEELAVHTVSNTRRIFRLPGPEPSGSRREADHAG